jgi:methylmalonyl-CoA mutase cobalamin-binding domain/chain
MDDSRMNSLVAAILEGDCAASVFQAEQLHTGGVSTQDIVMGGIETAMAALDSKCTLEEFNLLEIMLAGRAVTEVMKFLYPDGSAMAVTKATVVIAALEGDVHDLGKNILKTVLTGSGFRVVDCGKDCPVPKLIEVAEKEQPLAVGISGLITHIIPLVRQVKDLLRLRGLEMVKVMAGGAALKQSSPDKLNVDFVAESAFDGVHYLDSLAGGGQ